MGRELEPDLALVDRLLDVIEHDILPLTADGVRRGNKIFGAAILRKSDRGLVVAETNNEIESPLWHGEMHALKRFYELPGTPRPATRDCLFLATHEPCSLCLSAITWCGFDNFFYLFSHEDSRDAFAIPHDLRILKEVFTLDPGGYNPSNAYWMSYSIPALVAEQSPDERKRLQTRIDALAARYQALSGEYQRGRPRGGIPFP